MKKGRVSLDYLNDMLEASLYARQFVADLNFEQFKSDSRTQFAVIRALEIIGEAGKKIPTQVKSQHPEIPWRLITGMRDKVIHDYVGVNLAVIWKTVCDDVQQLIPLLRIMIEELSRTK